MKEITQEMLQEGFGGYPSFPIDSAYLGVKTPEKPGISI